jgi:PEGA domain
MKFTKLAVVLSLVVLAGCSTIFKGTDQVLTITSEPDGADVRVDGKLVGQTPVSYKAPKNKVDSIRIEKDGYKPEVFAVEKKYDTFTLLSTFWDLSTTDLISGAAYEYQPSAFHYKLRKEDKK